MGLMQTLAQGQGEPSKIISNVTLLNMFWTSPVRHSASKNFLCKFLISLVLETDNISLREKSNILISSSMTHTYTFPRLPPLPLTTETSSSKQWLIGGSVALLSLQGPSKLFQTSFLNPSNDLGLSHKEKELKEQRMSDF